MRDWFHRWVLHNFALKVLALAIAVVLWWAVAREPRVEVAHTVPVEFVNVPDGLQINTDKVPAVQVWLSGPERVVRGVSPEDLHPVIDLQTAHGLQERSFTVKIKSPPGVDVQVLPSDFRVRFSASDRSAAKPGGAE